MTRALGVLLFALLPLTFVSGCQEDCPDGWLPSINAWLFYSPGDPDLFKVTATVTDSSEVVIDEGGFFDLLALPANTYNLALTYDGSAIGNLAAVCARGPLHGCDAKGHSLDDLANVGVIKEGTTFRVYYEPAADCPSD